MPTPHIEANLSDIAPIVLMPGDPKRAEYIAKNYLTNYKKVNEVRGEDAYTGYYKDKRVTIFSSGMGIPSMGIYSHELFNDYNVDVIIRIGSCGSYKKDLCLRDVLLVKSSYSNSNYDYELLSTQMKEIDSNKEINEIINNTSKENNIELKTGKVYTTEAFYNEIDVQKYIEQYSCIATEMECYSLFLNAYKSGKKAACLLTVSDSFVTNEKMTSEEREKTLNKMITLALESIIKI